MEARWIRAESCLRCFEPKERSRLLYLFYQDQCRLKTMTDGLLVLLSRVEHSQSAVLVDFEVAYRA